ncbi:MULTISPECIES: nucleotide exchange factor GrpE [unclassified Neptuniibacter]|jgi:molecular chaperone GrpE|uniref:nucleotide exchange factor GrpE n=1 Tax=unclassified Neptuniibacter TaxID=2630693 RepID=UPI0026E45B51|nr:MULTISPECIES: nucleotide exchange factor GrpE [unclassified Neptuniibacter]MDO6513781.1 nucleotide exchange factor GrpE [Neptuniibacter sp. 2_MG-2023]MDO6593258.1 nucleotide exchange factor GrpE [Neptuniibacter sp. 1_MG-2023]
MAHEEQTPQDKQQTESVNDEQLDAAEAAAEKLVDENEVSEEQDAEKLAQELAAAVAEVESLKDQMLRIQAEAQNVRRRAEQDVEKAHKFGVEKFANEMLPIVDSLERAIEAFGDDEALQPVREGVEMTMKMFLSGLEKFKMEQVSPLGETFDPALHQAMSMVDAPDAEPNSVIAVMQKGYTLHGRLVRPAMVVVAKG